MQPRNLAYAVMAVGSVAGLGYLGTLSLRSGRAASKRHRQGMTHMTSKEGSTMAQKRQQSTENKGDMADPDQETVNVLELLKEDHRTVEQLFESFKEADNRSRQGIANEALKALEIHAKIEESLVYPAIREATGEEELVDEAFEEHHVVKFLIRELQKMKASAEGYKAKFTVLGELVKHHVKEEEEEMFPEAEQTDIDWEELGEKALAIKERMMKSSKRQRKAA